MIFGKDRDELRNSGVIVAVLGALQAKYALVLRTESPGGVVLTLSALAFGA